MTTAFASPQFAEAAGALLAAERILLVTHVNPDGDAIGSLLGLASMLATLGKTCVPCVDGGVPEYLSFVPGAQGVAAKLESGTFDVMVSLDASDEPRTGDAGVYGRANSALVINIDHHPTNTAFGHLHLIAPEAVSTTQVLHDWFMAQGWPVSTDTATALLTGLVTDTIGFRTNNVTPHTLSTAAALMAAGASLHDIVTRTLNANSWRSIQMWKHALQTVAIRKKVISVDITQEALRAAGLSQSSDTGGLVGFLVSAGEAEVAVVFKEQANTTVELSLRAKPGRDVAQVAFALGGGGHKLASGATVSGTLEEVRARVLPMLYAVARGRPFDTPDTDDDQSA
jgi:bifunctional oligoribonuclease and PAP phosphatase NrnA